MGRYSHWRRRRSRAIASSDPIWCPEASPTPGANGCTQSFTSFTALLTFTAAMTYSGAGTIYVEQGNYQGGRSTINFSNFNLSNQQFQPDHHRRMEHIHRDDDQHKHVQQRVSHYR
jgi:hypothetical protein